MAISEKTLQTLEFDKIRELLAQRAATAGAREKAMHLSPLDSPSRVERLLAETEDARALTAIKGLPSFYDVHTVRDSVDRAEKGASLSPHELLEIAGVLRCARTLQAYLQNDRRDPTTLDELFDRLRPNRYLEDRIYRSVSSDDLIADEASPALNDIRRKMQRTNVRIREMLQKYISGNTYSKYLQENIITMRNGRYVVPVKSEYKNEIHGLVHDTSSSGATLFIEPMGVVEANNDLRVLETQEQKEIERVLAELSAACADCGENLIYNDLTINELAFIFAKAELADYMRASRPTLVEKGECRLLHARHPLLPRDSVVPVDLYIGGSFDTLVVTGPNTGGKTVTLKTLGLLVLMAQAGLHIPASALSRIRLFESVYADIGDEQSIEQSLSTFSAHMASIVPITEHADENSLVLLDELGAGTDPVEGAALAVAILEHLRTRGACIAATTHYAELKAYALKTEGVMNASCEFDVETLRPTYRLIIGTPGRSNAFAISKKLGLSEEIVNRAGESVDSESKEFETVLQKLEDERYAMERSRAEAEREKAAYEAFRAKAEEKVKDDLEKAEDSLQRARTQAQRIVESARASSDFVLAQLGEIKKKKNQSDFRAELAASRDRIRDSLREADDVVNPVEVPSSDDYQLPRPLVKGDEVYIRQLGKTGTVCDTPLKGDSVTVLVGTVRTRTKLRDVMLAADAGIRKKPENKQTKQKSATATVSKDARMELDLRGENGEDGWFRTDKYLDECIVSGMHTVTLIHGKGTGALRRALWQYLKKDPRVLSFRSGGLGEGDTGVTVVELK